MKLVHESLDHFLNEMKTIPLPGPKQPDWIDPEELKSILFDMIEEADTMSEAWKNIIEFINDNPYIHSEVGEFPGHDYYLEAIDSVVSALEEKFKGRELGFNHETQTWLDREIPEEYEE
jgi:hypothetical protein